VVSVVLRVVVVSPYGETAVPVVVVLLRTTPSLSTERSTVVSLVGAGTGTASGAVVSVVVEVTVSAIATPDINVRAVAAASKVLVISSSPVNRR
jgi:hypothetical protein